MAACTQQDTVAVRREAISVKHRHCYRRLVRLQSTATLLTPCLLAAVLATSAEARPRAERVAERRLARAEQAAARAEMRLERFQPQAPVAAPGQTLRPGVVRRLLRQGMTPEEIAAISRGGAVATPRGAQPPVARRADGSSAPPEQPRQVAGSLLPRVVTPPPASEAGQSKTVTDPQVAAAAGGTPDGTRSVLVTGEEPAAATEGPIFPGLGQTPPPASSPAAPVVTHEPVELLPTPKPQQTK